MKVFDDMFNHVFVRANLNVDVTIIFLQQLRVVRSDPVITQRTPILWHTEAAPSAIKWILLQRGHCRAIPSFLQKYISAFFLSFFSPDTGIIAVRIARTMHHILA